MGLSGIPILKWGAPAPVLARSARSAHRTCGVATGCLRLVASLDEKLVFVAISDII